MLAGQRSQKVRLLPLITLYASARSRAAPFIRPSFTFQTAALFVRSHWFVLFAVASFAVFTCRLLLPVNSGGKQEDMCASFVMHKQEAARVGYEEKGRLCVCVWRWGEWGGESIPINGLLHSAMQIRLWVSVALSRFLKWVELESDWRRRVRWILSS